MTKRIKKEVVRVQVEITWGRQFNGEYEMLTPGVGRYVTVYEDTSTPLAQRGPGFSGAPLGRGPTTEMALADYVGRGKYEYRGLQPLSLDMLLVTRTIDYRQSDAKWVVPWPLNSIGKVVWYVYRLPGSVMQCQRDVLLLEVNGERAKISDASRDKATSCVKVKNLRPIL